MNDLQNFLGDGRRGDGGGAAAEGSFVVVVVVAAAGGEAEGQEKKDYDDEGSDEDADDDPETEAEDGSPFGKLRVDESCVVHWHGCKEMGVLTKLEALVLVLGGKVKLEKAYWRDLREESEEDHEFTYLLCEKKGFKEYEILIIIILLSIQVRLLMLQLILYFNLD